MGHAMKNREIQVAYIVAVLAVLASFAYGLLTYQKTEVREIQHKRQIVNVWFDDKLSALTTMAFDYSYWDDTIDKALLARDETWAKNNIGSYLIDTFDITSSFLFDQNNQLVFAFGDNTKKLSASLQSNPLFYSAVAKTIAREQQNPKAFGFYYRNEGNAYLVAVSATTRDSAPHGERKDYERAYLTLVRHISQADLNKIAKDFSIEGLSFKTGAERITVPVVNRKGEVGFTLYYTDTHSFITEFSAPLALLVMTLLAFIYLLRLLHDKSQQAQALNAELQTANEELATFNKRLEEQVKRQTVEITEKADKAEEASRAKSIFLSSMSHELRTPLNGILGFAQMLRLNKENNLTDKQMGWLQHIVDSGGLLLEIVNGVLDLARIESGRIVYQPEAFRTREVFKECHDIVKPMAEARNISLMGYPDSDLYVYVDRSKLKQVLLNLINNAVKYGHEGGYVKFGCRTISDTEIELYVKDNGKGIPENELPCIFEPFHRAGETTSRIEGTGVGLTIVKKNLQLMDGKIDVDSTYGEGTCFTIILAAQTDGPDEAEVISPPKDITD